MTAPKRPSKSPARDVHEATLRQARACSTALDNITDLIFFKDLDGVYLGCNTAFAKFVGRPTEDIVGKTDHDLFGKEVADSFREHDRAMLAWGDGRDNEEWITYPDGSRMLCDTLKSPFRDSDGNVAGILGISRDITARKQAEESLRRSEANFRTFFDSLDDLVVVTDTAGRILHSNQSLRKKLGYSAEDLSAMHVLDLHPASCRKEAVEIFGAMARRERDTCPLPVVTKRGRPLPVDTRVCPGIWNGENVLFGVSKDLRSEQEATQRFERLFRNNPYPMVLATFPEGRMLDINDAIVESTGYARGDLIGHTAVEVGFYLNSNARIKVTEQLVREGRVKEVPLEVRHKDGRTMSTLLAGEVFESQGEKLLMLVFMDITARKQAEQALKVERERLDGILRGTHAGTWEWNVQTGETLFNERWAEIVGYSLKELQPISIQTWERLSHPADLAASAEALHRHFRKETDFYEIEARMRHKSGEWVWVLDRGRVMSWTPEGLPLWMLGTHQDITPRKRAEEELLRLSRIQAELMHLSTGFVNLPLDRQDEAINQGLATMGRLIQADRAYLFLYDFERDMMSNTHEWCAEGISPEIANLQQIPTSLFPEWASAHRQGELVHIPSVAGLPPAQANLRDVLAPQGIQSLITLPLIFGGQCLGFVGFDAVREERVWGEEEVALLRVLAEMFANLEARRAAECRTLALQQDLRNALEAAQEAAKAKSLFLANMSHEIRTPLNAILGYAQLMTHECRECPMKERLRVISRSGEHLLGLLNNLLELARSEGRLDSLSPTEFDLHQILEDVRLMFRKTSTGVPVHVSFHPGAPRYVFADPGKVRQILVNLVGNAVKFTERGFIRLEVGLERRAGEDHVVIEVIDSGTGIPPEECERIFELFTQLGSSDRRGHGLGLGLPLSRRYARALGGDLTVTSTVGQGSRFRFSFATKVLAETALRRPKETLLRLAQDQPTLRVLLVDDDTMSCEVLASMLKSTGFQVETAMSAEIALELVGTAQRPFDLLLLDKRMPGLDGFAAIPHFRRLPGGARMKIIMVTASVFADGRERSLEAGADGHVAKPVWRNKLLEEIGRVTGIQYDTAEPSTGAADPADTEQDAVSNELAEDFRDSFVKALRRGDIRAMRSLVDEIAGTHRTLATAMRNLVDAYDYDALERLLDPGKAGAP